MATEDDLPIMPAKCKIALWYALRASLILLFLNWMFPSYFNVVAALIFSGADQSYWPLWTSISINYKTKSKLKAFKRSFPIFFLFVLHRSWLIQLCQIMNSDSFFIKLSRHTKHKSRITFRWFARKWFGCWSWCCIFRYIDSPVHWCIAWPQEQEYRC